MEELAFEAEMEYRQLGRIERGETNATIITLLRLAQVLEVDITEFFQTPKKK
jgi:transcriptional regulator with XRE-family HTH domain